MSDVWPGSPIASLSLFPLLPCRVVGGCGELVDAEEGDLRCLPISQRVIVAFAMTTQDLCAFVLS